MLRVLPLAAVIFLLFVKPALAHDAGPSAKCSSLGGTPDDCLAAVAFYTSAPIPNVIPANSTIEWCADALSAYISGMNLGLKGSNNGVISNSIGMTHKLENICARFPKYANAFKAVPPIINRMYDNGGGSSIVETDLIVEPVKVIGFATPYSAKALAKCESGTQVDCNEAVRSYASAGVTAANTGHMEVACANFVGKMRALGHIALKAPEKSSSHSSPMGDVPSMMPALQAIRQVEQVCNAYPADVSAASDLRDKMKSLFANASQ